MVAWALGTLSLLVACACALAAIREATEPRSFAHWHRKIRREQRRATRDTYRELKDR